MAVCVKNHKRFVDTASGKLEGHPVLYKNVVYGLCITCKFTRNKGFRAFCAGYKDGAPCLALPPPATIAAQVAAQEQARADGTTFGKAPYVPPVPAPALIGGQNNKFGKGGQGSKGKADGKCKGKGKGDRKGNGSSDAVLLRKTLERLDLLERKYNDKGGGKGDGKGKGGKGGAPDNPKPDPPNGAAAPDADPSKLDDSAKMDAEWERPHAEAKAEMATYAKWANEHPKDIYL